MANTLKIKRGAAASIPQGQLAEPLFTTDTYDLYIGKGSGGNQRIQNYIASGTSSQFLKGDGTLDSTTYQATSEKGQNNGYASLDAGGKIPAAQLPSSVIEYKGTWNASTNTPTLADGTGDAGDVYIVSVGGTQNLGSGSITFDAGDWVMYNGSIWQKSTGSNAVASVNGQTGVVTITFDQLSPMTTLGDTIYGAASGAGTRLAGNITVTKKFLSQTGTGTASAAPSWQTVTQSDVGLSNVENTALSTWAGSANITTLGTITSGTWNGTTIAIANGGTGQTTKAAAFNALSPMTTLGDIIYGGASGAGTRLAGNTTASKRFLIQTGDGTNSAAPSWGSIAAGDVPTLNQNTTGSAATLTTARTLTIGATGKTFDGSANVSWSLAEIGAQATLTNPVTGTGTNNYIPKFTATGSTIGDSSLYYSEGANFNEYTFGSIGAGNKFNNSNYYILSNSNASIYLQFGSNKYAQLYNLYGDVGLSVANTGVHSTFSMIYFNGTGTQYTAIYSPGGEGLRVKSDATLRLTQYTSNGFVKTSGGDGTLSVDTTSYLPLTGGTLTGALSGTSATFSGDLTIDTNTFYVDSTNNRVNIGTTTGVGKLYIAGTDTTSIGDRATAALVLNNLNGTANGRVNAILFGGETGNTNSAAAIAFKYTSGTGNGLGDLIFATRDVTTDTAPTTRLTISSTGAATFSSSVTAGTLYVNSTTGTERINVNGAIGFQNTSGTQKYHVSYWGANTGLNFAETGVADARLFIKDGGNVGIGNSSPIAQLGITATGYTASLSLSGNSKTFNKAINGLADGQGGTPQYYHFATYTIGGGYYTEVVKGTITCGRSYQANNLSVNIEFTISVANGVLNAVYLQTEWKYFSGNFYVIDAGSGVYKFVVYNDFANQTGLTYDLEYYAEGGTGGVGSMFSPIAVVTTTTIPSGTPVTQYKNSYIKDNGRVGIGTISPGQKLSIQASGGYGLIEFKNSVGTTNGYVGIPDANGNVFTTSTAGDLCLRSDVGSILFGYSNAEKMRIKSDGEVLIGTTTDAGAYLLQINGSVYATSYFESSDIRLKDVITNSYSENFSAIEFMWKDKRDEKKHWGYAAQDVMKYIPDAIQVNNDGMMTVNYNEAHTWKIAQLEKEILELKAKING